MSSLKLSSGLKKRLLNFFIFDFSWEIHLCSQFDFETCVKRLQERIDSSKAAKAPMYGEIKVHDFLLFTIGGYWYWFKWRQPFLYGKFIPRGEKTEIKGSFGDDKFRRKWLAVWVVFMLVFFMVGFLLPLLFSGDGWNDVGMFLLGIVLIYTFGWFDIFISGHKKRAIYIAEFVKETLEATDKI